MYSDFLDYVKRNALIYHTMTGDFSKITKMPTEHYEDQIYISWLMELFSDDRLYAFARLIPTGLHNEILPWSYQEKTKPLNWRLNCRGLSRTYRNFMNFDGPKNQEHSLIHDDIHSLKGPIAIFRAYDQLHRLCRKTAK